MKVAHVSTFDRAGGAARAALRLHEGLGRAGVESRLFVRLRQGADPGVEAVGSRWATLRQLADAAVVRLAGRAPGAAFTAAPLPERVLGRAARWGADVVNLHWIGYGFLGPAAAGRAAAPVVWTLHDSWAFTGGCHVPGECVRYRARCGACPALGGRRDLDLSRWGWWRRRRGLRGADLTVVTPSRWLAAAAAGSSLLAGRRIEVIPNGVDLARYRPLPRDEARRRLGLPGDLPIVLFSAYGGTGTPNKGFDLLAGALRRLAGAGVGVRLLLVGAPVPAGADAPGVPAASVGTLDDDDALALAYASADVVAVPSRQENLPNVVMEAQACGRPVVAFRVGGLPEMVRPGVDGALAEPFDVAGLAAALGEVLGDEPRWARLAAAARAQAEERWGLELQARRYRALYEELCEGRVRAGRARGGAARGTPR